MLLRAMTHRPCGAAHHENTRPCLGWIQLKRPGTTRPTTQLLFPPLSTGPSHHSGAASTARASSGSGGQNGAQTCLLRLLPQVRSELSSPIL
jgi:hypothetical protein